jgi:hypothetical protein
MDFKPFDPCVLCGAAGDTRRRLIPTYGVIVCANCYSMNADGWAPHYEEKITAKLRAAGKPIPAKIANGLLPRDVPGNR